MKKSTIFIGASAESLDIAYACQEALEYNMECTVWSQGVFIPSYTNVSSLLLQLERSQYGLFIASPDDLVKFRDQEKPIVRDNVVFEIGLFLGRLGLDKCFILSPRSVASEMHLPTDLLGISLATYDDRRQDGNLVAAVGPACNQIRRIVSGIESSAHGTVSISDLNGLWTSYFVEDAQEGSPVITIDLITASQSGRKIEGKYSCVSENREDFFFDGFVSKDAIIGTYKINDQTHTGMGNFQLRASKDLDWLEGFCNWVNYYDDKICSSKHVWVKKGCQNYDSLIGKAEAIMREEIALHRSPRT